MNACLLRGSAAAVALLLAAGAAPPKALTPGEIVSAAGREEWRAIAAKDLLVMELAPDAAGKARQVVIQLVPTPFSQGWVGNIRILAAAHWWDGTTVYRVQDNYVAQWGDDDNEETAKAKPLPSGLKTVPESEYTSAMKPAEIKRLRNAVSDDAENAAAMASAATVGEKTPASHRTYTFEVVDPYGMSMMSEGWPIAVNSEERKAPVHCYGTVGVARDLSPDTGTGAELYAVIGHAPRHLDRNIAVVGRVIEGIQHLSSLPRGPAPMGVYANAAGRVPILRVRLASQLPAAEQPRFEVLDTEGPSFARYAAAMANRRDAFFIAPAGGVDICNLRVPIRRAKS